MKPTSKVRAHIYKDMLTYNKSPELHDTGGLITIPQIPDNNNNSYGHVPLMYYLGHTRVQISGNLTFVVFCLVTINRNK